MPSTIPHARHDDVAKHLLDIVAFCSDRFENELSRPVSLGDEVSQWKSIKQHAIPVERYLSSSIPKAHVLCRQLRTIGPLLQWEVGYDGEADSDMQDRFGYAEIIGPNGLLEAGFSCGLTLLGPNLFYPWHQHPAKEIYTPFSAAQWGVDNGEMAVVEPGAVVLHKSNQPHAMRTTENTLLALWVWEGDLLTAPVMC